ncbi:MAG: hypothetical protein ACRD3G_15920 [Vicinamibacterales bacterium]
MRTFTGIVIAAGMAVSAALNPVDLFAQGAKCDRACLTDVMTRYLNAMVAHDPSALPVAPDVKFTEDTVQMKLGEGAWTTVTKLRPYRVDVIDVPQGVAAVHAVVEENGAPVLFAARLKVVDRRLAEIETMVVRNREEGALWAPDNLKEPTAMMLYRPQASERMSRDQMVAIATRYPDGLRMGSFEKSDVPFAPNAYRFENGVRMAGPGCTFQPPSCENMRTQRIPTLAGMKRRLVAVDEEMGVVLFHLAFGRGSLPGPNAQKGMGLVTFEAFKVYGGQMHAAEAIFEAQPAEGPFGWE